ncbi:MAG: BolA/IbaG family iron-sulfur metabolism protein [Wenzhouxiangella sp.]
MDPEKIQSLILQAMPGARVSVASDDNVHFTARVVSAEFSGCSRIERHRRVHDAIGPAMGREIHALSLVLKAPEEDAA